MTPKLSIVIPNYNEMANLKAGVLDRVNDYLKTAPFTWEVIINEDDSTDGSREFIDLFVTKHPGFILLKNSHLGKAGGLKAGIEKANGKFILTTDMDQSTPLKEVEKLLPLAEDGFEAVIGSRGRKRDSFSLSRVISSNLFLLFRRALLLHDIIDTQCGFKLYESKKLKSLFPKLSNFETTKEIKGWVVSAFDVELLFMVEKTGGKIKEVEVEWRNEDLSESKSRKFVKESLDMLKQILKVKWRDIRGDYETLR